MAFKSFSSVAGVGLRIRKRGAIFFEEGRGDFVDLHVAALRGEIGGDQEFQRIAESEFAMGVGVDTRQGGTEPLSRVRLASAFSNEVQPR